MTYFEIKPARAKSKDPDLYWGDPLWYAEEKMDGWRYLMHCGTDLERTYLTGRRISKVTDRYSEKGLCAKSIWPRYINKKYTVLDGEIMPPTGKTFTDIAGIMNVSPENAAKKIEEVGSPVYHVFDILWYDGECVTEISQQERRNLIENFVPELLNPYITVLPRLDCEQSVYQEIVDKGGEGVILKNIISSYGESGSWIKVKRFSTIDAIVTGFKPGKGKYADMIGSLIISVYSSSGDLLEIGSASGMTDELRKSITDNQEQWIGKVVEIETQEFFKDRLKHPRFKRLRPDANPKEATFAKMMSDIGLDSREPSNNQLDLFGGK